MYVSNETTISNLVSISASPCHLNTLHEKKKPFKHICTHANTHKHTYSHLSINIFIQNTIFYHTSSTTMFKFRPCEAHVFVSLCVCVIFFSFTSLFDCLLWSVTIWRTRCNIVFHHHHHHRKEPAQRSWINMLTLSNRISLEWYFIIYNLEASLCSSEESRICCAYIYRLWVCRYHYIVRFRSTICSHDQRATYINSRQSVYRNPYQL